MNDFVSKKKIIKFKEWLLDNETYFKNSQTKEIAFRRILDQVDNLLGS